jgi:Flp pilus assembly pilin Flp
MATKLETPTVFAGMAVLALLMCGAVSVVGAAVTGIWSATTG